MAAGGLLALALWSSPAAQRLPWAGSRYACPVHSLTGLLCMGCGATRALRSLLAGDLAAALRQNGLFVFLLAGAAWLGIVRLLRHWGIVRRGSGTTGHPWQLPKAHPPALMRPWLIRLLLGAALAFMVVRNLDLPVARLLRP